MNDFLVNLTLKFEGGDADEHLLDLYDLSQSLTGFQRSLAITTHLVLNGEVITQSPSMKGAFINAMPARPGSWEIAILLGAGHFISQALTAPKDTPLGNLVRSAYDYVVKESLGFHVDYDKTLGQQYEEIQLSNPEIPRLKQFRFDSVIEKCQKAITEIHRPIFASHLAKSAKIISCSNRDETLVGEEFNEETYEYIHYTEESSYPELLHGSISSFNLNTYHGRIFITEYGRPVPFSVHENMKNKNVKILIAASLAENAKSGLGAQGSLNVRVFVRRSRSEQVKNIYVVEISPDSLKD